MKRQLEQARLNPELILEKLWLAAKVIESTEEGLMVTDTNDHIQIINPAFSKLTGYEADEALSLDPNLLASTFRPTMNRGLWKRIVAKGKWQGKLWLRRKDGSSFLCSTSVNSIASEDGNQSVRHIMLFTDITDSERAEQRRVFFIEVSALTDKSSSDLETLTAIARLTVVRGLASSCLIHLSSPDGIKLAAKAAIASTKKTPLSPSIVTEVVTSGKPVTTQNEHSAIICVPITLGNNINGTVTLIARSDNQLPYAADLDAAQGLARRLSRLLGFVSLNQILRQFQNSLNATSDGILIVQPETYVLTYVNQAVASLLDYKQEKLVGMRLFDIIPDFDRESFDGKTREISKGNGNTLTYERALVTSGGQSFPADLTVQYVPGSDDQDQYIITVRDLSDRRRIENQLEQVTTKDPLTNLPNRNRLLEELNFHIRQNKKQDGSFALLYFDLDRFKTINDSLGHRVGDKLLYEVGQRIRSVVGINDMVARLGGDEFAVFIKHIANVKDVSNLADLILAHLQAPYIINGQELFVTPSLGISLSPDDAGDTATLLQHAEAALYQAKQGGRNTYRFYSPPLDTVSIEKLVMENGLRHALERKELFVEYQPHVRLGDGKVTGAEALVRWKHPELGILQPGSFIPLAEEIGLLGQIDSWVLEECCRQLSSWKNSGGGLPNISINISNQQIRQNNFTERLCAILQKYAVPPESLQLEITEHVVMDNSDAIIQLLDNVRKLGVKIALDDFGTGYSSLSYLKHFPLDVIKVDQSFVRDCLTSEDDAAIITAIVSMAHSLNLKTVAEGVERKEQLEFLMLLDCEFVQGFIFSHALSANRFIKVFREQPFFENHTPKGVSASSAKRSLPSPDSRQSEKSKK